MARSLRTGPRDRDMKPDAKTRDLLKVWKGGGGGERLIIKSLID